MYDGKEESVKMEFANHLAGVVIDRFGKYVNMHTTDNEHFIAVADIAVSPQFFGWVMSLRTKRIEKEIKNG